MYTAIVIWVATFQILFCSFHSVRKLLLNINGVVIHVDNIYILGLCCVMTTGYMAGSHYTHKGSTANYICLPDNPQFERNVPGFQGEAYIYGTEYETGHKYTGNDPFRKVNAHDLPLHDQNVPCVMCHVIGRGIATTFPAWKQCPTGWTQEYWGYLVSQHYTHASNKVAVCMDEAPQVIQGGTRNQNGALVYNVEAACGSLPCQSYINGGELTCAVCSR